jgi:hypothetical protein
MESNALFHVIDVKTTYNILLGWPWIHENDIVSSTLHQCFKYRQNRQVRKIVANTDRSFYHNWSPLCWCKVLF